MKQLDFPVSAAAVHLHGREFHAQDFYDPSAAADQGDGAGPDSASRLADADPHEHGNAAPQAKSTPWKRATTLVRWALHPSRSRQ